VSNIRQLDSILIVKLEFDKDIKQQVFGLGFYIPIFRNIYKIINI